MVIDFVALLYQVKGVPRQVVDWHRLPRVMLWALEPLVRVWAFHAISLLFSYHGSLGNGRALLLKSLA